MRFRDKDSQTLAASATGLEFNHQSATIRHRLASPNRQPSIIIVIEEITTHVDHRSHHG